MIAFLARAWRLYRSEEEARRRDAELRDIALRFNDRHTYVGHPGKWMCPTCNKVHFHNDTSVWTGRHFPACCHFASGSRFGAQYATTNRKSI